MAICTLVFESAIQFESQNTCVLNPRVSDHCDLGQEFRRLWYPEKNVSENTQLYLS